MSLRKQFAYLLCLIAFEAILFAYRFYSVHP